MGLSDIFNPYFSVRVRASGSRCFEKGRVHISHVNASTLDATCEGSGIYDVLLTRNNGDIVASCTCSYFMGTAPCKHLWALLLAVDQGQYWRHVAKDAAGVSSGSPQLVFPDAVPGHKGRGDTSPSHASNDPDEAEENSTGKTSGHHDAAIDSRMTTASVKNWESVLDAVSSFQENSESLGVAENLGGEEIHYLVDPNLLKHVGELVVSLSTRKKLKNGRWSRPRELKFHTDTIESLPDSRDRQILALLSGASRGRWGCYGSERIESEFTIPVAMESVLIPRLCDTGRLFIWISESRETIGPIGRDDGPPWELRFTVKQHPDGQAYRVDAKWHREGKERTMPDAVAVMRSGWVIWNDMFSRAQHYGCGSIREFLDDGGNMEVASHDWHSFLNRLVRFKDMPPLDLPDSLQIKKLRPMATPVLNVIGENSGEPLFADLRFDYDGTLIDHGWEGCAFMGDDCTAMIMRDVESERLAKRTLESIGFSSVLYADHYPNSDYSIMPFDFSRAASELLAAGWRVTASGKPYRVPGEFSFNVSSGIDWFELRAACSFEDAEASLPEILKAVKKGQTTITLGDGSVGLLPDEWLKKFGYLIESSEICSDHLRFKASQAAVLDALLEAQPSVSCDEMFHGIREKLARFKTLSPADPPPKFRGTLRPYQKEGLGWLDFLQECGFGGCLADDMGLGKTVQVLAILSRDLQNINCSSQGHASGNRRALIVVPRSLVFNWEREAKRFSPDLRVLANTGISRVKYSHGFDGYDIVLMTYGTVRRDIAFLREINFDYVILDESQAIKNATTSTAKAVRLLKGRHRLALSGTPIENHIGELWSMFEFLNPGMFGTIKVFNTTLTKDGRVKEEAQNLLAKAVRPFILRRTKSQVAPELPEKLEETIYCELEKEQRGIYNHLRDHYRQSLLSHVDTVGLKKAKIQVLEALLRLRQAAIHPGLIDKSKTGNPSAKLDSFLANVLEILDGGHKVLAFSQFTSMLAIVRDRLDAMNVEYEYLSGRTRRRDEKVDRFQNDDRCKLFLISMKAGGYGLNLTAAEYVFILDPWWNPAVESQAIDRAHRIGQTRNVFAYRLIARDTVEEKVVELQRSKQALADAIIQADGSLIRDIKREDLELLLA